MSTVIRVENLLKEYRLGAIGHGMLFKDLQSSWARFRGKDDPNRKLPLPGKKNTGAFRALSEISFDVQEGDVLGIIGRNGAGKSTLLKILSRITNPTKGKISIKGRVASLLEVGTGFHPELTGRENTFLNGAILGMNKREIKSKLDEIIAFADIEQFIDTPVKRYSSGMYVRLAFAVAAHLEPEILIMDEVLAVGDAAFQKKCLGKIGSISKNEGRTILFVSHNMDAINNICNRAILLRNGRLQYDGTTTEAIAGYFKFIGDVNEETSIHDNTFRRGNGTLRMKKFQISQGGHSGPELRHINNTQPLEIDIEYRTYAPTKGLCYALYLKAREGGNYIVRVNGIATEAEISANSSGKISIHLGKLDLPAGIYPVYLNLTDRESYLSDIPSVYDVLDELLPPIIIESDREKNEGFLRLNYTSEHSQNG